MTARLVLVIGDLFIPDRAPVSCPQLSFTISANTSSRIFQPRSVFILRLGLFHPADNAW